MGRKPIAITDFAVGISQNNPYKNNLQVLRLLGFKFDTRLNSLESRGGWADWDTSTDLDNILGIKRWYRQDGGINLFSFAVSSGSAVLYYYTQSSKSLTSLYTYSNIFDTSCPILWIDCGNQLLALPRTEIYRPISIKLKGVGDGGGIHGRLLGLDPPTSIPTFVTGSMISTVGGMPPGMIEDGSYSYCYTRCYGTKSNKELYGESAPSPIAPIYVQRNAVVVTTFGENIVQVVLPESLVRDDIVQKFKIYRTKKNASTFYLVGEILEIGATAFNDTMNDSKIDLSKTLPVQTGIPYGIRVAKWHPTLSRLFWGGADGFMHFSAAGYPDINPASSKFAIGDTGYPFNGIEFIRGNIYAFKEDGIFLVSGSAPNYTSVLIDSTSCVSAGSVVLMPDGVYFLGADGDQLKVFKFDGSNASSVSTGKINHILGKKQARKVTQAIAKNVNGEYCLSIMTSDTRFCYWPVPYNNILLYYNPGLDAWSAEQGQAGCMEVFDGPGDRGEVWIGESDPTSSAAKGTFFRREQYFNRQALTTYASGARVYNKNVVCNRRVSLELVNQFGQDQSLEFLSVEKITVRSRYIDGVAPVVRVYSDSEELGSAILVNADSMGSLGKYNEMPLTGDSSASLSSGKLGSMIIQSEVFEENQYNISDTLLRTGNVVDVLWAENRGIGTSVDAIEIAISTSNNE